MDMKVYEQYRKLLETIFHTDPYGNWYYPVALYDTYDSDRLVGVFKNCATLGRFLNRSINHVQCSITRNQLVFCRYRIERLERIVGDD